VARALWSGSLSFGLVNVPVQLVSAARDLDYHFHQLHEKDQVPVEQRRFCSKEGEEVAWEEIAHSYDLDGKQVIVTDEELGSVQPRKTRTIEVEAFVKLAEVDPIYFDHPYFLVPAGDSEGTLRAYRLLVDVMAQQERVALGRFVMRTKEYLVAVEAREGALSLTTLLFHDEVRPTKGIAPGGKKKPTKKQLDNAAAIIEELSTDWDPERYQDCYRERLKRVIDAKRKRKTVHAPKPEKEPDPVPDLMAALEATLERLRNGEDPRAEESDDEDSEDSKGSKSKSNGRRAGKRRARAKSRS
jgi:DNA end-binding protein Ku